MSWYLQTLPALPEHSNGEEPPYVANSNRFSLDAGVAAEAWECDKIERLCRYITRPPIADKRLSLAPDGNIRYALKTPYRDARHSGADGFCVPDGLYAAEHTDVRERSWHAWPRSCRALV